jgi:hypothetical protein
MRLSRTKTYTAFDGQVIFHMTGYRTLRLNIALDELERAYPALFNTRSGKQYEQILAFIFSFGNTQEIEFHLTEDSPEELVDFQKWWTRIMPKGDYRTAYHTYTVSVTADIADAWAEAVEATRAPSPAAPVELQPGAADRAETDKDFTPPVSESKES